MLTSQTFRKRTSYILIPLMVVYTFAPNFMYGAQSSGNDSSSSAPSPSTSMASNGGGGGVSADVSPLTGQLSLKFSCIALSGKSDDVNIDFSVTSGGEPGKKIYNFPAGCVPNLSYINTETEPKVLYIDGSQRYVVELDTRKAASGLKYFKNYGVLKFEAPSDAEKSSDPKLKAPGWLGGDYAYILTSLSKGTQQYFDYFGKLMGEGDRFGNHVRYAYEQLSDKQNFTAYNARLAKENGIIDSYGQKIGFDYGSGAITVTAPDGRKAVVDFSGYRSDKPRISVTNLMGRTTTMYYSKTEAGQVNSIEYPGGLSATYEYSANTLPYTFNGRTYYFKGVTKVTQTDNSPNNANSRVVITSYDYNALRDGHSFAGNKKVTHDATGAKDALMESGDKDYIYTTRITTSRGEDCGGYVSAGYSFNYLHLPMKIIVRDSNGNKLCVTTTKYLGEAENGKFDTSNPNYNMPTVVTGILFNSAGAKRSHQEKTSYDENGRKTEVITYNNGGESLDTAYSYFEDCFLDLVNIQTTTDNVDGTKTVTTNKKSATESGGEYIAWTQSTMGGKAGSVVTYTTDNSGRVKEASITKDSSSSSMKLAYTEGSNGQLTVTKTIDPGGLNITSSQLVDVRNGNVIRETDGNGNKVEYAYFDNGLTVRKSYPDGSWVEQDSSDPNKTIVTSSSNIEKTYYLDGFGNTVREEDKYPDGTVLTTSATYNELGKVATQTDSFGKTIAYRYDYQGRELSETDDLTNTRTYVYDDAALTVSEYYNGVLSSVSQLDDNGNTTGSTDYLSGSNVTKSVKYNGKQQEISSVIKNGDKTTVSSTSAYDADGNLIESTVTTSDGTNAKAKYTLSLFGDVISKKITYTGTSANVEKGTGVVESDVREYDKAGRLASLQNQLGTAITYVYDANGNITSLTDFSGKAFEFNYDCMNNITSMTGPNSRFKKIYNGAGGASEGKLSASLSGGSNPDKISYVYDKRGNLSNVQYIGNLQNAVSYDKLNRVASTTDFANSATSYIYDDTILTRISSVTNRGRKAAYTYYSKDDNPLLGDGTSVKEIDYSNGIKQYYSYDTMGANGAKKAPKLKSIITKDKDSKVLSDAEYTYDDFDRVSTVTRTSGVDKTDTMNNIKSYTYNDLGQLITESIAKSDKTIISTINYTYDIRGNILRTTDAKKNILTSYTYDAADHVLSSTDKDGSRYYVYDDNENMTGVYSDAGHKNQLETFIYNELNQLTEYKKGNVDAGYIYNAEGMRKVKKDNTSNKSISYFYSTSGDVINEKDSSGKMTSYFMAGGHRLLRAIHEASGEIVEWYLKNAKDVIGTVETDAKNNAALKDKYAYSAYGKDIDLNTKSVKKNEASQTPLYDLSVNPYKYSGYYQDYESGLYYLGARYYSPELMRFINRDTYNVSNRFAYCDADPVNNIDPNGHSPVNTALMCAGLGLMLLGSIFKGVGTQQKDHDTKVGMEVAGTVMCAVGLALTIGSSISMAAEKGVGETKIVGNLEPTRIKPATLTKGKKIVGLGHQNSVPKGQVIREIAAAKNTPLVTRVAMNKVEARRIRIDELNISIDNVLKRYGYVAPAATPRKIDVTLPHTFVARKKRSSWIDEELRNTEQDMINAKVQSDRMDAHPGALIMSTSGASTSGTSTFEAATSGTGTLQGPRPKIITNYMKVVTR